MWLGRGRGHHQHTIMGKQGPRSWPPLVVLQVFLKLPLLLGTVVETAGAAGASLATLTPMDAVVKATVVAMGAPPDRVV